MVSYMKKMIWGSGQAGQGAAAANSEESKEPYEGNTVFSGTITRD